MHIYDPLKDILVKDLVIDKNRGEKRRFHN